MATDSFKYKTRFIMHSSSKVAHKNACVRHWHLYEKLAKYCQILSVDGTEDFFDRL